MDNNQLEPLKASPRVNARLVREQRRGKVPVDQPKRAQDERLSLGPKEIHRSIRDVLLFFEKRPLKFLAMQGELC